MKTIAGISALIVLGCSGCSIGSPYNAGPRTPAPNSSPTLAPVALSASVVLTQSQIAAVRAHYSTGSRGNGSGNGRGRSGGLPPGIARNLERGKALPPGIAKQYLPATLVRTLPHPESGLEYVVAAGKLLLVEAATQVIRDVLIDAIGV